MLLAGCAKGGLTKQEQEVINGQGQVMRVLTVDDPEDSIFLRKKSIDFSDRDLNSPTFIILAGKMVSTVTDPSQDGVGIAGPQVGLSRRIIAVQRFDKEGEPFEVYPNVRIESLSGDVVSGQEGCLSVPGERGSGGFLQGSCYPQYCPGYCRRLHCSDLPARDRPPGRNLIHRQG